MKLILAVCSTPFSESSECTEKVLRTARVMNANQIGNVSHHHITAWRYSIITVLAAKFKNAYRGREGKGMVVGVVLSLMSSD